jgi:alanyl-tRNA synthetase
MSIPQNSEETKLKYLEDTYLFQYKAKVVDIFMQEDKTVIVLDETIFYPQGGGQPSDFGYINNSNGKFEVQKTIFRPEGVVWHIGQFLEGSFKIGQEVDLQINEIKRIINAKNHSAGHLIDWVIEDLEIVIKPVKGYHFEDGPYVEYEADLEIDEMLQQKIEDKANQLIQADLEIDFYFEEKKHESGKPMRIMKVKGYQNSPCGGTHVKRTSEIGMIKIRKIKAKKGVIKISYQIQKTG